MTKEQIKFIRDAMSCAKGDSLERANAAFSGMTEARLDQEWGQSGRTVREIWQDYKNHRNQWEEANRQLEALFATHKEAA